MSSKNSQIDCVGLIQAKTNLFAMLISLTLLFIMAQCIFFAIHYHVSQLVDSLANHAISHDLFRLSLLLPLIRFFMTSLLSYGLLISGIWFVAVSLGRLFKLSSKATYGLGITYWLTTCITLFSLNHYYFPHSFFALCISQYTWLNQLSHSLAYICPPLLLITLLLAYLHFFWPNTRRSLSTSMIGYLILFIGSIISVLTAYDSFLGTPRPTSTQQTYPHLILIGLDSLRPDHTAYFGHKKIKTPEIDHFLQTSTTFTQAYTPLARTFPAWISILTAKHPKHHHARANLVDPVLIMEENTLPKLLQQAGYETVYATDEKRFSHITKTYGFDHIIGPAMGANDFLLGGLNDFPLNNLLIHSSLGRWLFPYHYGNRAAHLTYYPEDFLQLVKINLHERTPNKPLFLAIHLCLSHWPFTWAKDGQIDDLLPHQYQNSVEEVDKQLGNLLNLLKENGLLQHSMVILLSDHGTTLGLPHDRIITKELYLGKQKDLSVVALNKLSQTPKNSLDFKQSFAMHTSYGQGSDILSMKQNHILLAFKGFGLKIPIHQVKQISSLMDIAPTLLDYLHLTKLNGADGLTLLPYLSTSSLKEAPLRALFMETGDRLADIETDKIDVQKVLQKKIGAYHINPHDGLLLLNKEAEQSIIHNKQRAILLGPWLLAHYPAETRMKLKQPPAGKTKEIEFTSYRIPSYWVLVNTQSGQWTIGLTSPFARTAPVDRLKNALLDFYGKEIAR